MSHNHRKRNQPYPIGTPFFKHDDVSIWLLITHDGNEVLVSESLLHIHATGATREEALENFWRVFFGYEDVQASKQEQNSEQLQAQLEYVRRVKAWEMRLREAHEKRAEERMKKELADFMDGESWRKTHAQ